MQSLSPSTGLTITNPLVLYRSLLATKRVDPDPAQHRLAVHLQKLYNRLKDYEPEVEYRQRLDQISRAVGKTSSTHNQHGVSKDRVVQGIFSTLRASKEQDDTLALTRRLTSHETAMQLQSPQGLLLYGEVGTGKSMLVDLLADCLPNRKKRRWHFNTFMLEIFARLEQLRRSRLADSTFPEGGPEEEHSILWLARDMISTSPILFLDEFQLPDRAASKILSNLFTSFFQLGGVLIATSNRMPEELARASGVEFVPPSSSRLGLLGNRWGLFGSDRSSGRSESMFSGQGDFTAFLEVLRARCEIWDMEGGKDWRRREAELDHSLGSPGVDEISGSLDDSGGIEPSNHTKPLDDSSHIKSSKLKPINPAHYFLTPSTPTTAAEEQEIDQAWQTALLKSIKTDVISTSVASVPWESTYIRVYGRDMAVTRKLAGTTIWSFSSLCESNLGPADYISLAATFHTVIITDVPILTLQMKNEARRFITLLDALYEARCKLLIRAAAGPDDLFFPEMQEASSGTAADTSNQDGTYAETFSEIYQDQTSPFRPNISSYTPSSSTPSYATSPLPTTPHTSSTNDYNNKPSRRSILADEDSDFGPIHTANRPSNPNPQAWEPVSEYRNTRGPSDGAPGAGNEIGPDFQRTAIFTGEDERFAYKRARSRLWEMCGRKWWDRDEANWWKPLSQELRRWERPVQPFATVEATPFQSDSAAPEPSLRRDAAGDEEALRFRHGASPFRTSPDPPPIFSWVHSWGMMQWGKKAGVWGKGVEGLKNREKEDGVDGSEDGDEGSTKRGGK